MHMKTQMISARIRARAKGFSSRRYMSYGLAALVPAMGLVGAARADAPAPTSGFTPIEISADIDADITSPAAASVDLHLEQDAVGIADEYCSVEVGESLLDQRGRLLYRLLRDAYLTAAQFDHLRSTLLRTRIPLRKLAVLLRLC